MLGLVVESLIPLLLLFIPNLGVVLALAFHALVLLTPAPNYAGGFSVSCACRLLLALPNLEQAASVQLFSRAGVIAGAVSSALVPSATFGAFAAIGAALLTALVPNLDLKAILPNLEADPNLGARRLMHAASYATALYAFVLPVLGLLHMGSSSM